VETKLKNIKKIDFESHFYDISVFDALRRRNVPPFYRDDTQAITWTDSVVMPQGRRLQQIFDFDDRLAVMDRLGISTMVLGPSPGAEQLDDSEIVEVCKAANDGLYAVTKKYPGRYYGSATLPSTNVEAACEELERCVKELGFVSWHTHSNYGKTSPDELRYRPIFQKAADLGVYVYLHPQVPDTPRLSDYGFVLASAGLGFTLDAMITITKMIISGLFDEIPKLTVMLGHLGEAMPFLLERMDTVMNNNVIKFPLAKNQHPPSYYFRNNILVSTSGNLSEAAFLCTGMAMGYDRIVMGSDFPYEAVENMTEKMCILIDSLQITEEQREGIYWKNAYEKLGLKRGV